VTHEVQGEQPNVPLLTYIHLTAQLSVVPQLCTRYLEGACESEDLGLGDTSPEK
jgi:hypothetical protein